MTDCLWHRIQKSGVTITRDGTHLYVTSCQPERITFARELAADAGATEYALSHGCACIDDLDEPFVFGGFFALFHPGPFTRAEYVALRTLRQRHILS